MGLTCVICSSPLTGKQSKYCSPNCQSKRHVLKYKEALLTPGMCVRCRRQDKDMYDENLCIDCRTTLSSKTHAHNLSRKYSLTEEEYYAILEFQGGKCAICRKPPRGRRLGVDHDHKSMKIRGLLCMTCNLHIVAKHRESTLLRNAAEYLENPPAERIVGERLAKPSANRRSRRRTNRRRKSN